ncbi:hypothetical protein [Aeoliella mucimassa]|uniref:Uncharacterized protein n=1 Tax=Aeoliella mucimassa TaxID=2527972 RepID=A0A518AVR8_9BACT|nr:hypothetical protein [Aeoliella mucimassa]QDU58792.1 hypothetical protein Pan181_50320 [Aeoliella mucimassa]
MALLARCPACDCELELPADALEASSDVEVECPACRHTFLVDDAAPRTVMAARPVTKASSIASQAEPTKSQDDRAADETPSFSASTLASFLEDAGLEDSDSKRAASESPKPQGSGSESNAEKPSELNLGNYKSLEELFNKVSAGPVKRPTIDEPPTSEPAVDPEAITQKLPRTASIEPMDDTSDDSPKEPSTDSFDEFVGSREEDVEDAQFEPASFDSLEHATSDSDEPAPTSDRRPTLGELFGASSAFDESVPEPSPLEEDAIDVEFEDSNDTKPMVQGESIDTILDELDKVSRDSSTPSAFHDEDEEATTEPLASPSFDFGPDSSDTEPEHPKGLRASMGLSGDSHLEEEEESLLPVTDEADDEISFAGVQAPSGKIPTRKRGGSTSLLKLAMGGVSSIAVALILSPLAVMWINHFRSNPAEPFGVAQYYPDLLKPAEFRSDPTTEQGASESSSGDTMLAENDHQETGNVIPLNFEETISPPDSSAPAPWDEDDSAAAPLSKSTVEITGAPKYPAAEIMELTKAAKDATSKLLDGSLSDSALRPTKGGGYASIAPLADAITFAEGEPTASWNTQARAVFPPLFATAQSREEIALISSVWLTSDRRTHGGIFFSGQPDKGRQQGSVAEYEFTLPNNHKLIVLTSKALPDSITSASHVGVIGSVIDQPAERIEGYTGSAEQVIWSNDFVPVR